MKFHIIHAIGVIFQSKTTFLNFSQNPLLGFSEIVHYDMQ